MFIRHTAVNRVEAHTNVQNLAEQHALEKEGFAREGIVRGAQWRGGAYRRGVLYSRLRRDVAQGRCVQWPGLRPVSAKTGHQAHDAEGDYQHEDGQPHLALERGQAGPRKVNAPAVCECDQPYQDDSDRSAHQQPHYEEQREHTDHECARYAGQPLHEGIAGVLDLDSKRRFVDSRERSGRGGCHEVRGYVAAP